MAGINFKAFDLGGHEIARRVWKDYYAKVRWREERGDSGGARRALDHDHHPPPPPRALFPFSDHHAHPSLPPRADPLAAPHTPLFLCLSPTHFHLPH